MFNRNANGGSLFGNANTSTPTSTPTPAPNTFQIPQKSGNIFGNTNSNLAVSTPSPSGAIFGNSNTQNGAGGSGGLFGNQSTTSKPLFSSTSAVNNNNNGPSLFGNASTSNGTSLFDNNNASKRNGISSGGLFGNGSATSGGLFSGNPTTQSQSQSLNGNYANSDPYGLNINNVSIPPVSNMPAPITSSKGTKQASENLSSNSHELISSASTVDNKRNFSASNSSFSTLPANASLPSLSHSSLVNKLSARLKTVNQAASVQGLFSPFRNKLWDNRDPGNLLTSSSSEYKPKNSNNSVSSLKGLSSLQKGEISDLRKLKIDPTRSAAKKVKLMSGMAVTTKSHGLDDESIRNWDGRRIESDRSSVANLDGVNRDEFSGTEEKINGKGKYGGADGNSVTDYWCSPSLEKLSRLPMKQLSVVPNFVIGRKGYGCITFNREVDLTKFAPNLEEQLFGNIVVFHPTKTVEVYPDESEKAPIGYGLNVPATISLENIYPIDRKTKKPLKGGSRSDEVQLLIKRLKHMRDMEFISYNPFGGIWTFKVNHFSIWGIISEEDMEVDTTEMERLKNGTVSDRTLAFPKNKRRLAQSNAQSLKNSRENIDEIQNDLLALEQPSEAEVIGDLIEDPKEDDLFMEEKPYEPDISERDFEGMEVDPSLNVSTDWVTQLKLAGSSLQSVFAESKNALTLGNDDAGVFLTDFNQSIKLNKKIKKERRLTSELNFAHFCCGSKFLVKDSRDATGARLHNLVIPTERDVKIIRSLFKRHLKSCVIMERQSNAYPVVIQNSLQFKNVLELHNSSDPDYEVWKLCSLLFDEITLSNDLADDVVKVNLLKKERHKLLCSWIVSQVQDEINSKIRNATNALDEVFLYLAKNDIIGASQKAIKSQNGHLAILISLLGSNDPTVRHLTSLQLEKWKSGGNRVDPLVARIYCLLTGDLANDSFLTTEMMSEFSWMALLGIVLYYGKIDEFSLEHIINEFFRYYRRSDDNIFFILLNLFSTPSRSEDLLKRPQLNTTSLRNLFPWYFSQIMRFRTDYQFSNIILDRLTLTSVEDMKFGGLYEEALLAACFISNDSVARQQLDLLIFHNIETLSNTADGYILDRLKISPKLICQAKALSVKYDGNHLSEAKYLLKAKSFKEAEKVIVTLVGPRLIIQSVSTPMENLKILRELLSSFPQNEMENWGSGLGVFDNFLKLILDRNDDEELCSSLINGLIILNQNQNFRKEIPVCCNIMAQELVTTIIKKRGRKLDDNIKGKLLRLPLGQPEKIYLECMLAQTA